MDQIVVPLNTLIRQPVAEYAATEEITPMERSDVDELAVSVEPETEVVLPVDLIKTEPIEIKEIVDTHGRLSDILESFEDDYGISVIPLRMAKIAPEVSKLDRHEIFSFGNNVYAMSQRIRNNVCDTYLSQIVSNISAGIPFELELMTSIVHEDETYETLLLSRAEWTYIMSKCRNFVESLTTDDNQTRLTLHIGTEKA